MRTIFKSMLEEISLAHLTVIGMGVMRKSFIREQRMG